MRLRRNIASSIAGLYVIGCFPACPQAAAQQSPPAPVSPAVSAPAPAPAVAPSPEPAPAAAPSPAPGSAPGPTTKDGPPAQNGELADEKRTQPDDVLSGNPIQLRVSREALTSDLPEASGPVGLDEAVKIGLKNNLDFLLAERSWLISKYKARSALGRLGPSASVSTFFAESSIDQMLFFMPEDIAAPPMQPITKGSSFHLLFAGWQPLFTGGRLLGGYKAARARERQSLEGYNAERIRTALRIKEAYWKAAWDLARLQVAEDYVRYRQKNTARVRALFVEGKVPKADYLREEAELARARQTVNDGYRDFNTSLVNLKVVLGVNIGSALMLKDRLEFVETQHDVDYYLEEAKRQRPEIRQADSKVRETEALKMVTASKYAPQVALYGLGSNATGKTPGVSGTAEGRWGGTVAVIGGFTLFDSGQRLNELRAARQAIRQAEISRKDVRLKVAQDVSLAWIDLDLARRNVALARDEVVSAREDERLFEQRYFVGKSIELDWFLSGVKYYEAQLAVLEAIYKYRVAQARLIWASGSV